MIALAKRDILEAADNDLWGSLILDADVDGARLRYAVAKSRVEALGFSFKSNVDVVNDQIEQIIKRVLASHGQFRQVQRGITDATLTSTDTISEAFDIYCDKIMRSQLATKSKVQKASWKKVKKRAVTLFRKLIGDKPMAEITREDANKLYVHWLDRIAPTEGKPSHTASIGNRDLGNLRVLFRKYFAYLGDKDRKNPFAGLSFAEKKKRKRPPFPTDWIEKVILKVGALAGMNDEQRGIVLAIIETGARPSEICNLTAEAIVLHGPAPHLKIEPRDDPDDPREIKTESSIRNVPLVGVALEVFKKHPNGFPRYREKEASLSAAANKYFRENRLLPTTKHKLYSLRHSFEDRMKEAGVDEELRRILMGHAIERPRYGIGGSLEWRRNELLKIELPFDPAIV
jgi:integrase